MFCLQSRPFSPPTSGSPPPFAPLARAESSSSISSITSQSAASTPTLGKDLNLSTAGTPPACLLLFNDTLQSESLCVSVILMSLPHGLVSSWFSPLHVSAHSEASQPLVWFDHGRFYLAFEGELSPNATVVPLVHGLKTPSLLCSQAHCCPSPSHILCTYLETMTTMEGSFYFNEFVLWSYSLQCVPF